jgi:oxygen-dependent protoporphyrinogen oxidase
MIGKLNPNDKRVTIVGAGISGLLIGYALKRKGYQVTIHEKTNRCGGLIQTKNTPYGIVETAAHSILVNETVKSLLDELGVEVVGVNPDSKARYIYRKGKMRRMPLTFIEIIKTLIRFFSKPKLSKPLSELTLAEWGNAYLGHAATEYLLAPFTTGVFACHPKELNTKLSFPKLLPATPNLSLFQHLRSHRKNPKSDRGQMMVFKHGTEELIQKL